MEPLLPGDPRRIGRYFLRGRVGEGGQGTVYWADALWGERVAVKVFHRGVERLGKEVRAAQRVQGSHTARVIEADLEGAQPYIVSEFVTGRSLTEVVEAEGALPAERVLELAQGTADALVAIHSAGVVHRDLKPSNVLMTSDGPRVIDFGLAWVPEFSLSSSSPMMGTPLYMAPEVFGGSRAGPAADVFAWGGLVLYAALGRHAFEAGEVFGVMRRVMKEKPDVSVLEEPVRSAVAAALAKDPAARPVASRLVRMLDGSPADRRPAGGGWWRRKWVAAVGAAACVIALIVVISVVVPWLSGRPAPASTGRTAAPSAKNDRSPSPTPTVTPSPDPKDWRRMGGDDEGMSIAVPKNWIKVDVESPEAGFKKAHMKKRDYSFWKEELIKTLRERKVILAVDTTSLEASEHQYIANVIADCYGAEGRTTLSEIEEWGMEGIRENRKNKNISTEHVTTGGREMVRVSYEKAASTIEVVMYWLLDDLWSCSLTMKSARMDHDRGTFGKIAASIRTHLHE